MFCGCDREDTEVGVPRMIGWREPSCEAIANVRYEVTYRGCGWLKVEGALGDFIEIMTRTGTKEAGWLTCSPQSLCIPHTIDSSTSHQMARLPCSCLALVFGPCPCPWHSLATRLPQQLATPCPSPFRFALPSPWVRVHYQDPACLLR